MTDTTTDVTPTRQPPTTQSLSWCSVCGRHDRYESVGPRRHYSLYGKVCPGSIERLVYILDPTTTGATVTDAIVEAGARALARKSLGSTPGASFEDFWSLILTDATREDYRTQARLVLSAMAEVAS